MNLSMSIINFLLALGLCFVLASCANTQITRPDGTVIAHTIVGSNAAGITVTADGVQYVGLDQESGMRVIGQTTSTVTGLIGMARVAIKQSADEVAKHKASEAGNTARTVAGEETTRALAVEETKRAMIEPPIP